MKPAAKQSPNVLSSKPKMSISGCTARTLAAGTQLDGRANQAKAAELAAEDETTATR